MDGDEIVIKAIVYIILFGVIFGIPIYCGLIEQKDTNRKEEEYDDDEDEDYHPSDY
jgi:hypothetical protein